MAKQIILRPRCQACRYRESHRGYRIAGDRIGPSSIRSEAALSARLRLVPQLIHFEQGRALRRLATLGEARVRSLRKRRSNLRLVSRSTVSGSASTMAGKIDEREQQVAVTSAAIRPLSLRSSSASISSASSRILARTARGSFQSKPTRPALLCSFRARG